jgi:hypothetical protein
LSEQHARLVDRLTYNIDDWHGSHLLKFGIEGSHVRGDQVKPLNRDGAFTYATDTSTLPRLGTVGVGFFNPTSGDLDSHVSLTGYVVGAYANDEWRPTPSFTINLGLRYDADINTLDNGFDEPWAHDPVLTSIPSLKDYLITGNRKNDLNNVSPRVSFSWDPFGDQRTLLRGGFGVMYDRVGTFIGFNERANAAWRSCTFTNPGTNDANVLRQRVLNGQVTAAPSITLVKNKMNTPENHQRSLGVGHQLSPTLALNVDYIHQTILDLYTRLNPNWANAPGQRQLTQAYGDITLWGDFGKARFDGVLTQATWQRTPTQRFSLAHTLGWYRGTFDNSAIPTYYFLSSYGMQPESGDERHRLVLSGIDELPFGFRVSTIATFASPHPYLATLGQDRNNDNNFGDDFINGQRVATVPNSWKNWYKTVDLRVTKDLGMLSGARLSLIAEAFNIFNWVDYSSFGSREFDAAGTRSRRSVCRTERTRPGRLRWG